MFSWLYHCNRGEIQSWIWTWSDPRQGDSFPEECEQCLGHPQLCLLNQYSRDRLLLNGFVGKTAANRIFPFFATQCNLLSLGIPITK